MQKLISILLGTIIIARIVYAAFCMAVEATLNAAPWLAIITH